MKKLRDKLTGYVCVHIKDKPNTIIRVKRDYAKYLVHKMGYVYAPKSVWRKYGNK